MADEFDTNKQSTQVSQPVVQTDGGGETISTPENVIELLDKLDKSKPETISTFASFMATISRTESSGISSLYPKFTPEHITIC